MASPTPSVSAVPSMSTSSPTTVLPFTFPRESVIKLRESDFSLDSKDFVTLKYDGCVLILFYSENQESQSVAKIWSIAASQVAGPIFAACNIISEKKVAEAFTRLDMNPSHPLKWLGLHQIPFIVVYRGGYPQAFYNGERTVETFIDYSLTLACHSDYTEHTHVYASMQAEMKYEMTMPHKYETARTVSTDYKGSSPLRGYNSSFQPVIKGSPEEQAELETLGRTSSTSRVPPTSTTRSSTGIPISNTQT